MAFNTLGLACVFLSMVLLSIILESEAGVSMNTTECGELWKKGCIKLCKRDKCKEVCNCEECRRDEPVGACWTSRQRNMECDCRECDTLGCKAECKEFKAEAVSAAKSVSLASKYDTGASEYSATAFSSAGRASHAVFEISDKLRAISTSAASVSVHAYASARAVHKALATAICECDHQVMADAIAAATECAQAAANVSAIVWEAAVAYAKATTKARAAANAATKASGLAYACASLAANVADSFNSAVSLTKYPDCDKNTLHFSINSIPPFKARKAMRQARSCAKSVAKTSAKAETSANVALSFVLKVETQVQLALQAEARAKACVSSIDRKIAYCSNHCSRLDLLV